MDKQKKIVVGIFPEFNPFVFKDEKGGYTGHDVELIREVARRLNMEIEMKEVSFPDLFTETKNKGIDLAISVITITPKRSEEFLFSIPYFEDGQVVVVYDRCNKEIKSFEDLFGRKVGVLKGSTGEDEIKKYTDSSLIFSYDSLEDIFESKEIEAMVGDYITISHLAKEREDLVVLKEPFTSEYYGIMTNMENKELMGKINKSLREMQSEGWLVELKKKWLDI